jgi:hypothetical protein
MEWQWRDHLDIGLFGQPTRCSIVTRGFLRHVKERRNDASARSIADAEAVFVGLKALRRQANKWTAANLEICERSCVEVCMRHIFFAYVSECEDAYARTIVSRGQRRFVVTFSRLQVVGEVWRLQVQAAGGWFTKHKTVAETMMGQITLFRLLLVVTSRVVNEVTEGAEVGTAHRRVGQSGNVVQGTECIRHRTRMQVTNLERQRLGHGYLRCMSKKIWELKE